MKKGIEFTVHTQLKYDENRNRHYLEVMNSIASETIKHYYHIVDSEFVKNIPQDVLVGSYKQLKREILRRASND